MFQFLPQVRFTAFLGLFLGMMACSLTGFSLAHADLIGRLEATPGAMDYQAYYDTDLDITWAADANINGLALWADQVAWASGLTIGGVSGWRLPTSMQPDASCSRTNQFGRSFGTNCTGSEMGHLYYTELGNVAFLSSDCTLGVDCGLVNTGPFSNVQALRYWSGTDVVGTDGAWDFNFINGSQGASLKLGRISGIGLSAWAVRDGDVGAIPEPSTMLLFGSGLAGLVAWRYRKSMHP